jgi:type IV secretion system protein VirB8
MFGKKRVTAQVDTAVARAVNFEITIADLARRSERRAWMVAWMAILISLILTSGYFILLPLKEKVPYLVMADAYTGTSTVARLTGNLGEQGITTSEVLNKSNIAHFVMARESYDYSQFGQQDWNTVHAMGTQLVTADYSKLYARANPDNPQTRFGRNKSIRVRILSLQLHDPAEIGGTPKSATVRYQRSVYDKGIGVSSPLDSKIASLEFSYNANLKMDEPNRLLNPLGFQVTSYRVDNDYAASPPIESGFTARSSLPSVPDASVDAANGNPVAGDSSTTLQPGDHHPMPSEQGAGSP